MTTKNINESEWEEGSNPNGEIWRFIDLSGERLGVRIEELPPKGTSSVHHYHTLEEEHVLVLVGNATLILGDDKKPLKTGDHFCFLAGKEEAHHIENTSDAPFKFLVFGERNEKDLVIYPEHQIMLVKALNNKQLTYRPFKIPENE